jgi:hypothetical protein
VTERSRIERMLWLGAGLCVLAGVGLTAQRIGAGGAGVVLVQDASAPWIMVDRPPSAMLQQWGRTEAPVVRFATAFETDAPGPEVRILLRAFGRARVSLNGAAVPDPAGEPKAWKRFRTLDAAGLVRPGRNELQVEVANKRGPALLALRIDGAGAPVATGPGWTAALEDGATRGVRIVSDALPFPDSFAGEKPLAVLTSARYGPIVALLLLASGLAFVAPSVRRDALLSAPGLPRAVLAAVVVAWFALLAITFRHIDLRTGFDAGNHLDYLLLMRRDGTVPLATDHWATYHPPLFYLVSGAFEGLAGWLGRVRPDVIALKLVPFLAGLGNVFLADVLARRILPEERAVRVHAILFAAILPVNLYTAAYYSNEGLHAFLAAAGLVVGVMILLEDEVRPGAAALVSLLLGLALLTKFTALLVAAPVLGALGLKICLRHTGIAAAGGRLAALLLPALLVCGWFYARNLAEFGRVLVGNWNLPGDDRVWWSPPGFHTPQYYLRFGEVLVRPYFSGFVSFWDALYSTFWGDGFVAGRAGVRARHGSWNYSWMAAGYVLALPATLLLAHGFARCMGSALRDPEARRRAAFGLLVAVSAAMGFAVFLLTLTLPYHGQARANYVLALTPVLALCFARGFVDVDRRLARRNWTAGRTALHAGWGTLWCVLYLSFAA